MAANMDPRLVLIGVLAGLAVPTTGRGGFFYVGKPATNSADWTHQVGVFGGNIDANVNFAATPLGPLADGFYAKSDGVTLYPSGPSIDSVVNGAGPGQGSPDPANQPGTLSNGEGPHAPSNYLLSSSPGPNATASLTISFAHPVLAVGLFTIDYFGQTSNPGTDGLTLSIYSGADGTGTLIAQAQAIRDNFQQNNLYFMGYVGATPRIGSAVFGRSSDVEGDDIGIAGIRFATGTAPSIDPIPEPSSIALLALGSAALAARRRTRGPSFGPREWFS